MTEFERLQAQFGWTLSRHAVNHGGVWTVGKESAVSYPDEGRDLIAEAEERSPWFGIRNRYILDLLRGTGKLPSALWDVGSGNGWVSLALQRAGVESVAVEPSLPASACAARRGVKNVISGLLADLQLPPTSLEAAGCFDVLEHLENPGSLVEEIFELLRPGGRFVVTVPALPWLWSETDEASGHFRRYTRRSLEAFLSGYGFRPLKTRYMMGSLVLPQWMLRALPYRLGRRVLDARGGCMPSVASELVPANPVVHKGFAWVLQMEYQWNRFLPIPAGTSLAGVYQKP